MTRPTSQQLQQALDAAERLRDLDDDVDHVGRTLLYLQRRNEVLEKVLDAAVHYLRAGQDQHTHIRLVQAVEAARRQAHEESDSLDPDSAFGLE